MTKAIKLREWVTLCLSFTALLLFADSGSARPLYYVLKGITAINYDAASEKTVGGDRCTVDRESLTTAMRFVANQSTKLKIIPWDEHAERDKELHEIQQQIWNELTVSGKSEAMFAAISNAKYVAAKEAAYDYAMMPQFHIIITPIETISGCGGSVHATLDAYLDSKSRESMEILPTHYRYAPWTVEIWSHSYSFTGSKEGFAAFATHIAGDLMKEFVNDWSTAQDLQ